METVKLFNSELTSLYETRPPISKAKMTSITRTAIKAIKFYKHVVQSVEKFIQKCKPEYKVPGLYVIDSIVRQSRHQFTPEKDVFAPRFARNIHNTFIHLFNCPHDDKGKIVRVLNLWQKNQVFSADVIQPLLDMASLASKEQLVASNGVQLKTPPQSSLPARESKPSPIKEQPWLTSHSNMDCLTPQPVTAPSKLFEVKFDKKLLDFDYGEEEDEETSSPLQQPSQQSQQQLQQQTQQGQGIGGQQPLPSIDSLTSILSNPEVLRQLQTLQQQMAARQQQAADVEEKMRRLQEMRHQEEEFDKHLAQTVPNLPFAAECDFKPHGEPQPVAPPTVTDYTSLRVLDEQTQVQDRGAPVDFDERRPIGRGPQDNGNVVEVIDLIRMDSEARDSPPRRRRRSRSRSRGRARSRSRSRRRRSRSGDRDRDYEGRDWDSRKTREVEREKERERRRKGLPPIKKNHLAVCSTTLWIGHLSKLVQQEELSDTFGEYGDIVSINLIPPRGCAFVCMNRRQDAARALSQLKHYKLQGKAITIAWAPGKGMKDREWKDYWEVEQGVSYIPWSKLTVDTDFELLEEGGMLDDETFPDWIREKMSMKRDKDRTDGSSSSGPEGEICSVKGDAVENAPSAELDIPMPGSTAPLPPGFIPIPESTPVSQAAPPPPMGLIPPFALPPTMSFASQVPFSPQPFEKHTFQVSALKNRERWIADNVSLMGAMGMPVGVPLGVPPPLMMPQIPRMPPASPFNPQLLLGGADKAKGGGDFADLASPLVNPFALPVSLAGLNAAAGNMLNKGPAEMDVDDLSEGESKDPTPNSMSLINSMVHGGFGQGAPFGGVPLMQLAQQPLGILGGGLVTSENKEEEGVKAEEEKREGTKEEDEGKEDTDMRPSGVDDRKRRRGDSPARRSSGRRRDWTSAKPRVNRWSDHTDHDSSRRGRSPGPGNPPVQMKDQRPPPPLPLGDRFMVGGGDFGECGGYGGGFGPVDLDDRGGDDGVFMPHPPRGYFPRRPPPPSLLRTPNGPMFGPRGHPGMMPPLRGPRPGGRMDGLGFGMRGFIGGMRGSRGSRFPGGSRRWEEGGGGGVRRRNEEERKSRWTPAEEDVPSAPTPLREVIEAVAEPPAPAPEPPEPPTPSD